MMSKNLLKLALTTIVAIFTILSAKAVVHTVSNNPVTAGKYTDIQKAADAAKAGDTLYIHPSGTSYGNLVVKKQLTVIGGGYRRDEAAASNYISEIGQITFDETILEADKSKFIGIYMTSGIGSSTGNVDNVIIERCFVSQLQIQGDGWIIRNSVSTGMIYIYNRSNIIITNNVLREIYQTNKPSVLILNNFFIGGTNYFHWTYNIENAVFANNIFLNQSSTFGGGTNVNYNVFNNNAFIRAKTATFNALPGTNTGKGNIFTTIDTLALADANMIVTSSVSNPSRSFGSPFNKDNWTFELSSTSPGKNYGTDGTDIGIYGGAYPMQNINGIPNIPFITELNILNSVLPATDDLEFEIKAKAIK